jgi:hypothetical protein
MQARIFQGVINAHSIGPPVVHWSTGWSTRRTRKDVCACVSRRRAIHLWDLSGVDRPSLPSGLLLDQDAPDNPGHSRARGGVAGRVIFVRKPREKPTKPSPPTLSLVAGRRAACHFDLAATGLLPGCHFDLIWFSSLRLRAFARDFQLEYRPKTQSRQEGVDSAGSLAVVRIST